MPISLGEGQRLDEAGEMRSSSATKRLQGLGAAQRFEDDRDDEPQVSLLNFVFFSILGFLVLLGLAMLLGTRKVEASLEGAASAALDAAGYGDVRVDASGHDLLLVGTIGADQSAEEAAAIAAGIPGVGAVETSVWVVDRSEGDTLEVVGDPVAITWDGADVVVAGDVSSEEIREFIVEALADRFPSIDATGLDVVDGLAEETDWVGRVVGLVDDLAAALPAGRLTANPGAGVLIIGGTAADRSQRRELRKLIEAAVEPLTFDLVDGIVLGEPTIEEQVEELQQDLDDLLEGKVVEFEYDSARITDTGKALLDEVLLALAAFPGVPVEIAGHADSQGSAERNLELSEERARAVYDYLVAHGADPERFVVVGYGDTRPVADNSTEEGRRQNRRIEFVALEERPQDSEEVGS